MSAEWIVAAATLAVAWTAWQSLRRERRREEKRQEAVDARIGATAYALHRQIDSWWDGTWPSGTGHELQALRKSRRLAGDHFDTAEERIELMLAEAPRASEEVADAVRRASVLFYRATELINEMAQTNYDVVETDEHGDPKRIQVPDDVWQGFTDAFGYVIDCVDVLEYAIDPELLRAEEKAER